MDGGRQGALTKKSPACPDFSTLLRQTQDLRRVIRYLGHLGPDGPDAQNRMIPALMRRLMAPSGSVRPASMPSKMVSRLSSRWVMGNCLGFISPFLPHSGGTTAPPGLPGASLEGQQPRSSGRCPKWWVPLRPRWGCPSGASPLSGEGAATTAYDVWSP